MFPSACVLAFLLRHINTFALMSSHRVVWIYPTFFNNFGNKNDITIQLKVVVACTVINISPSNSFPLYFCLKNTHQIVRLLNSPLRAPMG